MKKMSDDFDDFDIIKTINRVPWIFKAHILFILIGFKGNNLNEN